MNAKVQTFVFTVRCSFVDVLSALYVKKTCECASIHRVTGCHCVLGEERRVDLPCVATRNTRPGGKYTPG